MVGCRKGVEKVFYMAVSIFDVASQAGVSISTVSRVISDSGYPVSASAKKKVLEAAKQLGFVPNRSAQALRWNIKNGIALLVRNVSDPYFRKIVQGVTETAIKNDTIAAVFSSMQDTEFEMKYYKMILRQQYDGVIIGGGAYKDEKSIQSTKDIITELQAQGCKVVALAPQGFDIPTISVDNQEVGYKATSHLISLGHKQIAFFGGYKNHLADIERLEGYKKALEENDILVNESMIYVSEYSFRSGYQSCERLIQSGQKVSAIYCSNDNIARGAIRYLTAQKIDVPKDISVMGTCGFFKKEEIDTDIGLTTIRFPFYELGKKAVEFILSKDEVDQTYKEVLPVEVVQNFSVGKRED